MDHRAASRRTRREDLVAASAPTLAEAPDAAVQRVETFRALVDLVLALEDPLRTTLVRHYFDGDTLAMIARRDCVPEGTVRWRHKQALDQLRTRLDRRAGGDRRAWLAALAPLASPPGRPAVAMSVGGLVVNKVWIAAAVVAVAGGVVAWRFVPRDPPPASVPTNAKAPSAALASEPPVRARDATTPPDASVVDHVRRLASADERREFAAAIAAARARRADARAGAILPAGLVDKQTIQDAMRELAPSLTHCFQEARPTLGTDHISIHAHLTLTGDPDIGTMVDADPLTDDDGQPIAVGLDACLRSTIQTLELPPLHDGDQVAVNYPMLFSDYPLR